MLGNGGDALSTEQLSKYEGFPSDRTLQRWKHDFLNPPVASSVPVAHGRPRLLNDQQLDVIGGFILFCASAHQGCSLRDIHEFVDIAFTQQLANSTLAGHIHALGFSSHHSNIHMVELMQLKMELTSCVSINHYLQKWKIGHR